MQKFGTYLLERPVSAFIISLLFSFLPLLMVVALVILGFITLRKGLLSGLPIMLVTLVPTAAYYFTTEEPFVFLVLTTLLQGLGVWLSAWMLRKTVSWSWTIQGLSLGGIILIFLLHWLHPHLADWWIMHQQDLLNQFKEVFQNFMPTEKWQTFVQETAAFRTGFELSQQFLMILGLLGVARLWQARLFNPGGLKAELYAIRMSRGMLGIGVALLGIALFFEIPTVKDTLPLAVFPFVLAGISLFHYYVAQKKKPRFWLWLFYGAGIILSRYMIGFLLLLGLVDAVINLRAKIHPQT